MTEGNGDWLRVRGLGRERFANYLADYLVTLGFSVDREGASVPNENRVAGRLERTNPAVPSAAHSVSFRLYSTSGGAALVWETPTQLEGAERARMDRFVREIMSHLERAISTESHATAKVFRPSTSRLPWEKPLAAEEPAGDPVPGG